MHRQEQWEVIVLELAKSLGKIISRALRIIWIQYVVLPTRFPVLDTIADILWCVRTCRKGEEEIHVVVLNLVCEKLGLRYE